MGVVYEARQFGTQRIVALKLLSAGALATREAVTRFQTEAQAAARLEHPHIVPIHETGVHDGQYFLTMRFLTGGTLARSLAENPLTPRRAAKVVRTVAEAVQYAHQYGVLHRDLKPGNILLDAAGEPHVADFGLARLGELDTGVTLPSSVLGTLNYMAPEQAKSGSAAITTAADIYGLGAVLYELLAGRPPFAGTDFFDTLHRVMAQEPTPPSLVRNRVSLAPSRRLGSQAIEGSSELSGGRSPSSGSLGRPQSIPADLETICLKCLQKEPAKRYGTAQELADDLGRYLADEPIHARPVGPGGRVWRWCRRKPVIAGLGVALFLAFALGLVGVLWQWRRAESNASKEARERRRAEAGELDARLRQYASDMNAVQQAWDDGNLKRAQGLLRSHIPKPGAFDPRGFEWHYLWNLCRDESRDAFTNFEHDIDALAFTPNGEFLAVGAGRVVKLLDIDSQNQLCELRIVDTNDWIHALAFSPRSTNLLATGGDSGVIRLWNLTTKESTNFGEGLSAITAVAFSPDGRILAAADRYAVSAWNLDEKRALWTNKLPNPRCALAFTPDGAALVSGGGGGNGNARVWDVATGKELAPLPDLHKGWLKHMSFSPDGRTLATSGADGQLILWDFAERRTNAPPIKHGDGSVAFSSDGRLIACIGLDLIARVWDVASQQPVNLLRGLEPARTLAFTPDGTRIVCGRADHTVRVWDATGPRDKDMLKGHERWIHQVAFSPDGKTLASVDFDQGLTKLWDVPTRRFLVDLRNPGENWGGGAAFSPNGKLLATSTYHGTVTLWDTATLRPLRVLTNNFPVSSLAFSSDGKVLGVATGFMDTRPKDLRGLAFWDVASRQKLNRLTDAESEAAAVAFSKDGRLVAVGYNTGWVRLWNWETGSRIAEFQKHVGQVPTVAFSVDGNLLASGGEDDEDVVVYNVTPPGFLTALEGHTGGVKSVAFAPDGKTLAVAGNDGSIRLWNLATHQLALTLKKHTGIVLSVAFTHDGTLLASCDGNGDLRLWPAPGFEEIQRTEESNKPDNDARKKTK
jgi:WD40 repeat protein